MTRLTLIKGATSLAAVLAVLAGAPVLTTAIGLSDQPAAMPASWETQRAIDAESAAASHTAVLVAERERKARAKARAKAKAAKERREAEARAARARASQGGTPAQNRALGMQMCADRGWSASQCNDLGTLWQRESGWNSRAHNPSGAHGIPQALPGSKMASHGSDWATSARTQISWGLDYIAGRYGNPSRALSHSYSVGWY